MAQKILAVNAYRPRIQQGNTVQKPEFLRAVSRATGLVEGTVDLAIKELRDQVIEFSRTGRAVKVEGLGTFTPTIDLDGNISLSFRADTVFASGLNVPGIFTGTILNRENIGKQSDELIAMWNQEHSEDPVVITE
jgi:hypothetical protein